MQLIASDSFVVYNISRKWKWLAGWMYIAVLSRTVVDSEWHFDTTGWSSSLSWLLPKHQSPVNNSPNKDYSCNIYTIYLYEMTPRLEPLRIIIIILCQEIFLLFWHGVLNYLQFSMTSAKIQIHNTSAKKVWLHFHVIQVC